MLGLARQNGGTSLAQSTAPSTQGVSRWDPWSEFDRIRSDMDGLFGRFFGSTPWQGQMAAFVPPIDLYETTEELVLNCYGPGMTREDIHLEVFPNLIHLGGESKPNVPDQGATVHIRQGGFGVFDVRYTLPVEVKPDDVRATYRDGVLEVRLPKADWAKPRPVEVQIGG